MPPPSDDSPGRSEIVPVVVDPDQLARRIAEHLSQGTGGRGSIQVSARYEGPTPPAGELERIEVLAPGATDRFLKMAENQQAHAINMDGRVLDANRETIRIDQRNQTIGIVSGLMIGLVTVMTGGVTAVMGAPLAGGFIGTGGVATLAAVFVYGSRKESRAPEKSVPAPVQNGDNES
jgi:uncharacterized membrane protein